MMKKLETKVLNGDEGVCMELSDDQLGSVIGGGKISDYFKQGTVCYLFSNNFFCETKVPA